MDEIDTRIISILEEDSRTPFLKMASHLNVSEGTVRARVKKLVEINEIKKFTINTKRSKTAIIGLKINTQKNLDSIQKKLFSLGISKINHVSGRFDLMIETKLSRKDLNSVLDKIRLINGIEESETFMILEESEE